MKNNELDQEYYLMVVDGADNHPLLAWGDFDDTPFLETTPLDVSELELPLKAEFDEPFPKKYEMADLHMLSCEYACSEGFKKVFDENNIYGVEFFPLETITDNKGAVITGYYATHIWNTIRAIDMNNYIGPKPNRKGNIIGIRKFSLDVAIQEIPLEKRLIFELGDSPVMYIVHQSLQEKLEKAGLKGFRFFRVDDWDEDAMFR